MTRLETITVVLIIAVGGMMVTAQAKRPARQAPRLPKATAIPLQPGDLVSINGMQFRVSYSLTPESSTPTPIPTPTPGPTTITGIRNPATGQFVTSAAGGTPLLLEGTGLGTGGRLQFAGRYVADTRDWSDTRIAFTAPNPGGATVTGGWDLFQPTANGFKLIASTGVWTLLPAGGPSPPVPIPPVPGSPTPICNGFRDSFGARRDAFIPGDTVFIQGTGFGDTPGSVKIDHAPVKVLTWTDKEITLRCPSLNTGAGTHRTTLDITTAAGPWESTQGFVIQGPPGGRR